MTKRALQLSLAKMQSELTTTRNRLIREKAEKNNIKIVEEMILDIKKTRYDLSSRTNKDSCSMENISFGMHFWDKKQEYEKEIIKSFYNIH